MPEPDFEHECFFIAPIGSQGTPERRRSDGVLQFIVARAAEEVGLTAVRADQLAEPGVITRQVIDHVLQARAAVADLTGQNPNVYYELAVRHTARLPVVLIADTGEQLPFDIAPMRTIFFDHQDLSSSDAARADIAEHLRQALDGAVDSPISTSVDLRALQAGGSVVERGLADLVERVEELSREQRTLAGAVGRLLYPPENVNIGALRRRLDAATTRSQQDRALELLGQQWLNEAWGLRAVDEADEGKPPPPG